MRYLKAKKYIQPRRRKVFKIEVEREGHVYRIDEHTGKVIYMEDQIAKMHLNRKLETFEAVIHRNGDPLDNRWDNLEIVTMKMTDGGLVRE
jgi:hypothetical protein